MRLWNSLYNTSVRIPAGIESVPLTSEKPLAVPKINLLVTGRPAIGKTTVIRHLAERLSSLKLAGFYTEEIRRAGQRQGFRAVTFSGDESVLAHVDFSYRARVGRYRVDVAGFEDLVMPELRRPADLLLIDEIGKMECFSSAFVSGMGQLLDGPTPIVATVAVSAGGFIGEVKSRPDVEIVEVTHDNRDDLPGRLVDRLVPGADEPAP